MLKNFVNTRRRRAPQLDRIGDRMAPLAPWAAPAAACPATRRVTVQPSSPSNFSTAAHSSAPLHARASRPVSQCKCAGCTRYIRYMGVGVWVVGVFQVTNRGGGVKQRMKNVGRYGGSVPAHGARPRKIDVGLFPSPMCLLAFVRPLCCVLMSHMLTSCISCHTIE